MTCSEEFICHFKNLARETLPISDNTIIVTGGEAAKLLTHMYGNLGHCQEGITSPR